MIQPSIMQALSLINCVILRRIKENQFDVLHGNQEWFIAFEQSAQNKTSISFSGESAFLSDFILDAEDFWQEKNEGQIQSGIWSEQTDIGLLRLEAVAATSDGNCYLIINNIEQRFEQQRQTLQVARELLITNDKIQQQHDYIYERLEHALAENKNLQDLQQPIYEALQQAEFGVVILDEQLQPLKANPAVRRIFDLPNNASLQEPVDIIQELLEKQFPEATRQLSTRSSWSGELYWLKPPMLSRWLQFTVHPIKDHDQQLSHWLWVVTDISRVKYLQQNNEQLHLCDTLTGLPNRQSLWQHLNQAVKQHDIFYLLLINIRSFKRINELYGHLAGDQMLNQLVKRIQQTLGSQHFLARIGGNEFAVVLHDLSSKEACQKLVETLFKEASRPYQLDDKNKCHIELSCGATCYPLDAATPEELIKHADLAAFESKNKDKSELVFYSQALKDKSQHFAETEAALKEAIEAGQFELYLQPIMDLKQNRIVKAEALIRWQRPGVGLVMPNDFIPVAEQTGLIVPIGKWVISHTLQLMSLLRKNNIHIQLSVNLSPQQVTDTHLFEFIKNSLQVAHIDAGSLELELTEGVFVENYERAQTLLNSLRELGISVAIDDFGTGYSSLSYLQKLPIDNLKIDRSFVSDLDTNESDRAIVTAVIALAQSLKLGVIAEGVENDNQRQFLQQLRCTNAQGYLFSKPVDFDDFCELVDK